MGCSASTTSAHSKPRQTTDGHENMAPEASSQQRGAILTEEEHQVRGTSFSPSGPHPLRRTTSHEGRFRGGAEVDIEAHSTTNVASTTGADLQPANGSLPRCPSASSLTSRSRGSSTPRSIACCMVSPPVVTVVGDMEIATAIAAANTAGFGGFGGAAGGGRAIPVAHHSHHHLSRCSSGSNGCLDRSPLLPPCEPMAATAAAALPSRVLGGPGATQSMSRSSSWRSELRTPIGVGGLGEESMELGESALTPGGAMLVADRWNDSVVIESHH